MCKVRTYTWLLLGLGLLSACGNGSTSTIPDRMTQTVSDAGPHAGNGGSNGNAGGATASGVSGSAEGGSAAGGVNGGGGDTSGSAGAASTGGTATGSGGSAGGGGGADSGGSPPQMGCRKNSDCATVAGRPLCDAKKNQCIQCHTNAQCAAAQECVNSECQPLSPCKSSLDCASMKDAKTICDATNKVCVQCTTAADCGAGKVCVNRTCRTSCSSDNDCSAMHMLCNKRLSLGGGQCTECTGTECPDGKFCEAGTCVPLTCTPAQQSCAQNVVVQCNDSGSDVVPLKQCSLMPLIPACVEDGNNADCVGTCYDQRRDGLETDIDCGGPTCTRCAKGKACVTNGDCGSNKCMANVCE